MNKKSIKTCTECGAPIIDKGTYIDNKSIVCAACLEEILEETADLQIETNDN